MKITRLDHVQLAMPPDGEAKARDYLQAASISIVPDRSGVTALKFMSTIPLAAGSNLCKKETVFNV